MIPAYMFLTLIDIRLFKCYEIVEIIKKSVYHLKLNTE